MRIVVTLNHCSRPAEEVTFRAELFKEKLLDMACPEQIFILRHSFLRATRQAQRNHEWVRLYQSAFWNAASNTRRVENRQWQFEVNVLAR